MNDETRIVSGMKMKEDVAADATLRPQSLQEYIGQDQIKENMSIFIQAAKLRGEAMDHVLLYGPPGLGKTTLAHIIAKELNVSIRVTSGPAITIPGELVSILTNLTENDVLFIDEIHRLNSSVEEVLYSALEDYVVDIIMGKGASAYSMRLDLPKFTLVGATTRAGMLTSPLRDRFGIINRLRMYDTQQLKQIIKRSAGILNIDIDESGAQEIAARSRRTPRIANRLLRRVRDYADVMGDGVITNDIAKEGLRLLEVDDLGLDHSDRLVLDAIVSKFGGGPVGLDTLAATTGEEAGTIEDVIEPFLLQLGFLQRTPRGRCATDRAFEHLGIIRPEKGEKKDQTKLFE